MLTKYLSTPGEIHSHCNCVLFFFIIQTIFLWQAGPVSRFVLKPIGTLSEELMSTHGQDPITGSNGSKDTH